MCASTVRGNYARTSVYTVALQMHVVTAIIFEHAAMARKAAHTHAHACAVYKEQAHLNGTYMSCIVCYVSV